jgi:hypothetical protein
MYTLLTLPPALSRLEILEKKLLKKVKWATNRDEPYEPYQAPPEAICLEMLIPDTGKVTGRSA